MLNEVSIQTQGPIAPLAYRPNEAAKALNVGRTTVYALMNSGELHSIKVGGCRLIPVTALEAFLAGEGVCK
jgi:excisionase family DNA binding protein